MPDYYTTIPNSAEMTAALFNARLTELNNALADLVAGGNAINRINLGSPVELTIASGVVTRSRSNHTIDTEADSAEDDLTTINGGVTGDVIHISAAAAGRTVVVKHGTGNIYLYSNMDKRLDSIRKVITLKYDGFQWNETAGLATTGLNYNSLRVPFGMPLAASRWARNSWAVRAAAATVQTDGIAAPTSTGTPTASNQTDSTYINYATAATAGLSAGQVSATFNLLRRQYNPKISAVIRPVDLTSMRFWFGFFSAAPTSVDSIAGATEAAAFRFTGGTDNYWTPVTKDSSTQTTGSGTVAPVANQRALLQIELDNTNGRALFTVDNGTPIVITTNLPAATTELGFALIIFTTANVIRNFLFSRVVCEFD